MTYQNLGVRPPCHPPVRYAGSKLTFRGPQRDLDRDFIACIGGTETHGRFIARPWPALLEEDIGMCCVNFGLPNAGPDAFTADDGLIRLVQDARAVVLQIPAAMNLSNSHYRVHSRRNDRFLRAEEPLRDLYPEVDFTAFTFTRHMMQRLGAISPERFTQLRIAVQDAWVARMTGLIDAIGPPVILLWMAHHAPGRGAGTATVPEDPAFVSRAMLDAIAPRAASTVFAVISPAARARGTRGMGFLPMEEATAASLPGPLAHQEVAEAVSPALCACQS